MGWREEQQSGGGLSAQFKDGKKEQRGERETVPKYRTRSIDQVKKT